MAPSTAAIWIMKRPGQLLIAVILSAQCTDARVNIVTKELFKKYRSLEDFAAAELSELEQDIHSTGFYHMRQKISFPAVRIWWKSTEAPFPGSFRS